VTVLTGAGGAAVTVTVEMPLLPSLVAVIVASPAETPVTTPVVETVAMALLLVDHVTVRPVSTLPLPSLVVAVSVVVWPTTTDAVGGATVTVATGTGVTVTEEVPVFPSLAAVIVTVPVEPPVTTPVVDTVAIALLLVLHETGRSSTVPFGSFTDALNVVV